MDQIAIDLEKTNEIVFTTWLQLKHESFDSEQVLQKLCPQGIINIGLCSGASYNQRKHFQYITEHQKFLHLSTSEKEEVMQKITRNKFCQ